MTLFTLLQRAACAALVCSAVSGAGLASAQPAPAAPPALLATPASPAPLVPAAAPLAVPSMERHFAELLARFAPFDIAGQHLGFVSSELGGRVVKGAPYSAEAINESVQVLADGNRIVRKTSTRLARDGEGRTRQERVGSDGQVASVFINDPVSGKRWMLNPARKTATELRGGPMAGSVPPPPPGASAEEMRSWADQMRGWARYVGSRLRGEETRSEQTANGTSVTRVVRNDGNNKEIEVRVVRMGDPNTPLSPLTAPPAPPAAPSGAAPVPSAAGTAAAPTAPPAPPVPPMPPMPPMIQPLPMTPPPGEGVSTSLGSKNFDGVRADGTRTTWTIPAGRIGNEKPIEIVSERWYSPELMLVVASSHRDPRSGESSYRLANLKRGEPEASLFQVPAELQGQKK